MCHVEATASVRSTLHSTAASGVIVHRGMPRLLQFGVRVCLAAHGNNEGQRLAHKFRCLLLLLPPTGKLSL